MTVDTETASAPPEAAQSPNAEVIGLMRAHHAELAGQLRERTQAVLSAAARERSEPRATSLHEWYRAN